MKWIKRNKINILFVVGFLLLTSGLLWLVYKGIADVGFYGLHIGFIYIGKILAIIPFLIGIVWLYVNYESKEAKAVLVIGAIAMLIPVLKSLFYRFLPIPLYIYAIIMFLIFSGLGIVIRAIYLRNKEKQLFEK